MNERAPWEMFENFNEIVYASDMETYDIIYMNKAARDSFQITEEEYKKQKCYSLISRFSLPCYFCTNPKLKVGEFYEWVYHNPYLKRSFKLKDTMYCYEGRKIRIEIAIDLTLNEQENRSVNEMIRDEVFINSCLTMTHSASTPNESMNFMLQYMGQYKGCKSASIYEIRNNNWLYHTYCWDFENGICPVKAPFQIDFLEYIKEWKRKFVHNEPVILKDMEIIKRKMPEFYSYLAPEGVSCMVFIPLLYNGEISGFLRVDDPPDKKAKNIALVGRMMSHFIVSIIQRRNLVENLEYLSFHDQLTGALNRNALNAHLKKEDKRQKGRGVIYCDVIGLKKVNDMLGHASGDKLIVRAYQTLAGLFPGKVYRVGGDEFIILEDGKEEREFNQTVSQLKKKIRAENISLSIGSAWADGGEVGFEQLFKAADECMYEDKFSYYSQEEPMTGVPRETKRRSYGARSIAEKPQTSFGTFIEKCYFDAESFFQSVALPDAPFYLYCGDLEKNLYYISDNLKDDFNFDDNLVYDFVTHLENRIYEKDRQAHMDDAKSMLRNKRTNHRICYRIYNKNKELVWIECRGIMTWSDDYEKPLFFSGIMVQTDGKTIEAKE